MYNIMRAFSWALLAAQTWTLSLPNFLFSQGVDAAPAHISSSLDFSRLLRDREQNKLGAVASENSICSKIGIDLLKKGGNAADALVGTVLCVGVTGMYHR